MGDSARLMLHGRVFVRGEIHLISGLSIEAESPGLEIGSITRYIIRNPFNYRPYIPGSSLKGKMRSLAEQALGAPLHSLGETEIRIHVAKTPQEYQKYWVNRIFGVPSDRSYELDAPTRLIVRDVYLSDDSAGKLEDTPQPYAEVKPENVIDRITSKAIPRFIERVPRGAIFDDFEMTFKVYHPGDLELFLHVLECMSYVEDDYIGGLGSRGYGKIRFEGVELSLKSRRDYAKLNHFRGCHEGKCPTTVSELLVIKGDILTWLRAGIPMDSQ